MTSAGEEDKDVANVSRESVAPEATSHFDVVGDAELDALLEDALSDFDKPLPMLKPKPPVIPAATADMHQLWSEEFIREATVQFEKKIREYAVHDQGKSSPEAASSSGAMSSDIYKVVEAATKAALGTEGAQLEATLSETIRGLAVNPDLINTPGNPLFNDDELSKLIENLSGVGGTEGGAKDLDDLLPFMSNMMQKLLSKELLQPVLADIVERYPDWLATNRDKISSSDFDKYHMQYDSMKKICEEYAKEKADDSEVVKQARFDLIADLMLKVQTAGPPPKELVGEENSGAFMQYDSAASQQCSVV